MMERAGCLGVLVPLDAASYSNADCISSAGIFLDTEAMGECKNRVYLHM